MDKPRLLIIDDAKNLSLLYKEELQEEGYDVDVANSIPDASVFLNMKSYDLMIIGTRLKKNIDNDIIYSRLNLSKNEIPVIVVGTPLSESETKSFAYDAYIEKSSDTLPLKEKVNEIINNFYYKVPNQKELHMKSDFILTAHPVYAQIGAGPHKIEDEG
jgi:DNA-binding response OmpR family regulator